MSQVPIPSSKPIRYYLIFTLLHYYILTSLCLMHYAKRLPPLQKNKGTSQLLHYCIISLLCSRQSLKNSVHPGPHLPPPPLACHKKVYFTIITLLHYYINMIHINYQISSPPLFHALKYHLIFTLLHYYFLTLLSSVQTA